MKTSVGRRIKAFLRKRLRFFDFRHMHRPAIRIGGESAAVAVAHVASGQDSLRSPISPRQARLGRVRWPASGPPLREAAEGDRRGCRRGGMNWPSRGAVGARPTPPEGDVVGTHNGLRSHGRFRCLVIRFRRTRLVRLPADTYRRGVRNVEAGARMQPGC
jgi:hypothetical protein